MRRVPTQDATIAGISALELPMLQPVSMPSDDCPELPLRISGPCLVTPDRNRCSVPAEWVGKVVSVRISANSIPVVAGGKLVVGHERRFGRGAADLRAVAFFVDSGQSPVHCAQACHSPLGCCRLRWRRFGFTRANRSGGIAPAQTFSRLPARPGWRHRIGQNPSCQRTRCRRRPSRRAHTLVQRR